MQTLVEVKEAPAASIQLGKRYLDEQQLKSAESAFLTVLQVEPESAEAWFGWGEVSLRLNAAAQSTEAFLNGLYLTPDRPEPFVIRVLSILFTRATADVFEKFEAKKSAIQSAVWLRCLPLIVPRLKTANEHLKRIVTDLLVQIARDTPQPVLYALLVALNREDLAAGAQAVCDRVALPDVTSTILAFCRELVVIASSLTETWIAQIDAAAAAFARGSIPEMLAAIAAVSSSDAGTRTSFDESFLREFSGEVTDSLDLITMYEQTHDPTVLQSAWAILLPVLDRMKALVKGLKTARLAHLSPALHRMDLSQLIVPGSYRAKPPPVMVGRIGDEVEFLRGPDRPRRLTIEGSDGTTTHFVLQSNTNPQLDARFVLFFEFANRFVGESDLKLKAKLSLLTRSVLALTPSVGLVSCTDEASTLRELVVAYRARYRIPIGQEQIVETGRGDRLALFQQALAVSNGNELERQLLIGALDSEDWLDRRLNYTTSLVFNSIIGYLLGLVRRDPDAILIERNSARLFHVRLNDCFELQKETVPFRLTRLLMNALEVSKIEGTFRICFEGIARLIKQNTHELSLVLEVFIDDPLHQFDPNLQKDFMITRFTEKGAPNGPVADDVARLVADAASPQNQAQMPVVWAPWL
jgi:FKBP12-rapamycin complex-associated protein